MNNAWQAILASVIMLSIGLFTGKSIDHWRSFAVAAERETQQTFLRLLGHQQLGRHLLLSVYCDAERGHMLYTYTLAGESPAGNIAVIKDGCKIGK